MNIEHPHLLWLLLAPPLILLAARRQAAAIPHPHGEILSALPVPWKLKIARVPPVCRVLAFCLAVAALARPQLVDSVTTVTSKGVDIALALDLSSSMLAVEEGSSDRTRTRLALAKEVVGDFISRRSGDRFSVVAFGARAYPVAPLTLDHHWLKKVVADLDTGAVEEGTAIGDALLAAINRLRLSPARGRTVVLVTDGRSNTGSVTPAAAAAAAAALGIKVHTIGIGGKGKALYPVENPLGGVSWREVAADLDEAALKEIAAITGGRYFQAGNGDSLTAVFSQIDRLEKSERTEKKRRTVQELFPYLLTGALLLLMTAECLCCGRFGRLP